MFINILSLICLFRIFRTRDIATFIISQIEWLEGIKKNN